MDDFHERLNRAAAAALLHLLQNNPIEAQAELNQFSLTLKDGAPWFEDRGANN